MTHKKQDRPNEQVIVVNYRTIPVLVAIISLLLAVSFFAGFFSGQRYKSEQFLERFEHETLSDQIYSSMFALYDSGYEMPTEQTLELKEEKEDDERSAEAPSEESPNDISSQVQLADASGAVERFSDLSTNYYAQLIGFGSRNRADAFVKKLEARGVQVQLQKRLGKSPKTGKTTTWYQVTTPIFNDRHTLELLVSRLQKEEKLHDIRIITLT